MCGIRPSGLLLPHEPAPWDEPVSYLGTGGTFAIPGLIGLYLRTTRAHTAELAARVTARPVRRSMRPVSRWKSGTSAMS